MDTAEALQAIEDASQLMRILLRKLGGEVIITRGDIYRDELANGALFSDLTGNKTYVLRVKDHLVEGEA